MVLIFFFGEFLSFSANSQSKRYVYPTSNPKRAASIIPYPGFEFRERLRYCPARSCFAPTLINGLSRRTHFTLKEQNHPDYALISEGSKSVSVFIIVQAITSILAASLTRILVLMPRSFSRPSRYRVNSARNRSL